MFQKLLQSRTLGLGFCLGVVSWLIMCCLRVVELFRGFVSEIIVKSNIRVGFLPGSCMHLGLSCVV